MGRYRLRDAALAVVIVLALSACAGGARSGATPFAPGADAPAVLPDPSVPAPAGLNAVPHDPPLSAEVIRAKRAETAVNWRHKGTETHARHGGCVANDSAGTLALTSATPQYQWAIYQFQSLLDSDKTLAVTVEQSGPPQPLWLGVADYSRTRWHWRLISAPSGVDQYALPHNLDCINSGGTAYVAVVAGCGSAVTVQSVTLLADMQAPPPQDFSASDGTRADAIQLSWTDPATSYAGLLFDAIAIERAPAVTGPWVELAQVPAGTTSNLDLHQGAGPGENNLPYDTPLYYRARTITSTATGLPGLVDAGFRAVGVVNGLAATDGAFADRILVTWDAMPGAEAYELEYKFSSAAGEEYWNALATVPGSALQYFHTAGDTEHPCLPNLSYDYRVRARYQTDYSPGWSNIDAGYRTVYEPPVAVLQADTLIGIPPLAINFNASGSYDPDGGTITKYEWDWDGSGVFNYDSATDPTVSHTFTQSGQIQVIVRVTDDEYVQATTSVTLDLNIPPTAVLHASPLEGEFPLFVNFDASASADPDGAITKYEFDFGAGNGWMDYDLESLAQFTYDAERAYSARVRVTDSVGTQSISAEVVIGLQNDWTMYGHDPQHTNRSMYVGPQTSHARWSFATQGAMKSAPAIGFDGTLYVGSADGSIYAVSRSGALVWSYATGDGVVSSPALSAGGTLYVGSTDTKLYALDAADGSCSWSYSTAGAIESSPAIGADGTVYVGSVDCKLHAVNPDGTAQWSYTTGAGVYSSPAIGTDGTIYVGSDDFNLYALNPDGSLKWSYTTANWVIGSPAIGADGTVYVGIYDNLFYAINPDGTLKWTYPTGRVGKVAPAIGADDTVYVGSNNWKLYALNPDGTLQWFYNTDGIIDTSPAIGADGTVYIGNRTEGLFAIDADGALVWTSSGSSYNMSSFALGFDGALYFGLGWSLRAIGS